MNSAGIELKELDYSDYVQSISKVSVGCIGEAKRGPLVPTLITSQEELISKFGEPTEGMYGIYGAYFALTNVGQLYYQRVVGKGDKASAGQAGVDKFTYNMINSGKKYNGYKIEQKVNESNNELFSITIKDSDNTEVEKLEDLSSNEGSDNYAVTKILSESVLIRASANANGTVTGKELEFTGGTNGASVATAGNETTAYRFISKYPDSTINGCKVLIGDTDEFGYFTVKLVAPDGSLIENFVNLVKDSEDDRYIVKYINENSSRIQIVANEDVIDDTKSYIFSGGDDGIASLTDYDYIGDVSEGSGLQAFNNPETVDINILMIPGATSPSVSSAAVSIAEKRADVLLVADTPKGLTAQEAVDYANASGSYESGYSFNSSYASIFYPWVKVADPFTKKNILIPPSGLVASQVAYNDSQSYPWFAPAGLNRGVITSAIDLERSPSQGERDILYGNRNCVNPLVKFVGSGIVIWGQKTTQRKCTALDRINVRRLLNYLKKTILAASRYYLFEPNDRQTWNKWIDMVNTTLEAVKSQRGIYDLKVEMSPTDDQIDKYEMPGTIKIKPAKAAEFMELNFMIMSTSTTFDESGVQ